MRLKVGQGLVGAAVPRGRPLLVNDVHADPRYVEAVPGSNAELVVPLRRQGACHRRAEPPQRHAPARSPNRRGHSAPVRGARAQCHRERPAVRARSASTRRRSRRWRRSAARSARILDLDELLTRIANLTQARRRLPHVRHPAAQRGRGRARNQGRRAATARRCSLPTGQDGRGAGRLRRAAQGGGARPRRVARTRATSGASRTSGRSWSSRCC